MKNYCKRCTGEVRYVDEGVWRRVFPGEPLPFDGTPTYRTGSSICDDGDPHDPLPDLTDPLDIERWLSA